MSGSNIEGGNIMFNYFFDVIMGYIALTIFVMLSAAVISALIYDIISNISYICQEHKRVHAKAFVRNKNMEGK